MDQKLSYGQESYASPFAPGKTIFPEQRRIFHRNDCIYTPVLAVEGIEALKSGFKLSLRLRGGVKAFLNLEVHEPSILGISLSLQDQSNLEEPYFLTDDLNSYSQTQTRETEAAVEMVWDEMVLRIERSPFHLSLKKSGVLRWELDREEIAGDFVTGPMGFRWTNGRPEAYLSSRLHSDEQTFGFGEKWSRVEKSGFSSRIWNNDTCGSNTTDLSYKAIPWLVNSKGWGLLLSSAFPNLWEVGSFSHSSASCLVEAPRWDGFLLLGDTPKQLVSTYSRFTGMPSLPPLWALGIWMSRCAYQNSQEVMDAIQELKRLDIPCDVIHLDPPWMKHHYYSSLGTDACDFDWNEQAFPERREFFARLKADGIAVSLWVNPYLPEGGNLYQYAQRRGYLVRSLDGGLARLEFGQPVGIVDFTLRAAKNWWKDLIKEILRDGAALVKTDYADRIPEQALFADGRSGREMHHIYLHLYCEAASEAVQEVHGHGLIWRRPGYIGTQRFPISWAGDTQVSWEGLQGCMRGGLSAAFSGEAFWSHDIGGFCGPKPDHELYIRWMQFGMFSPCTRFHGTTPREPWHFGEEAVSIARHYAKLRYRLIPYLWQCAKISAEQGLPILRPMVLEFPSEPAVAQLDDQYMLGPDLLVAPVIHPGQTHRWIYLPQGHWRSLEHPNTVWDGGRFIKVATPLSYIPAFTRSDCILPTWDEAPLHLKDLKLH